jgi:hypothetical protein
MSRELEKTNSAQVLPFEYPYELGEKIWPCHDCYPWRIEMFENPEDEALWARESHAEGCRVWEDTNP